MTNKINRNMMMWRKYTLLAFVIFQISGCGTLEVSATNQNDSMVVDDGNSQDDPSDNDVTPEDDATADNDGQGQVDDPNLGKLYVTNASLHIKKHPIDATCKSKVKVTSTFAANREGKIHFKLHRSHKQSKPLNLYAPTKKIDGRWIGKHTRTFTLSGPLDRTYSVSVKNPNGQLIRTDEMKLSLKCDSSEASRTNPIPEKTPVRTNPNFKITSANVDLIKFPKPSVSKMCPRKVMVRTTFQTNMKGPGKVNFKQHRSDKPGSPLLLTASIKKIAGKWQAVHERIITVSKSINRSFMVESSNQATNTKASSWKKLRVRCKDSFSAPNNIKNS